MSAPTEVLVKKSFVMPITIYCQGISSVFSALIDSGAEGNFIHAELVQELQIPLEPLDKPLKIAALAGEPAVLGTIFHITLPVRVDVSSVHSEHIQFLVLDSSEFSVILGLPWLEKHNPQISWSEKSITSWSDYCHSHCLKFPTTSLCSTSIESPNSDIQVHIPTEYSDLAEVISKKKATQLPPHHSCLSTHTRRREGYGKLHRRCFRAGIH